MKHRFSNKVARQRRKESADVRKAAHDKLTLKQKYDKAIGKKERARLFEAFKDVEQAVLISATTK